MTEQLGKIRRTTHITIFHLMTVIYDYMSECYSEGSVNMKSKEIITLVNAIAEEIKLEIEGFSEHE